MPEKYSEKLKDPRWQKKRLEIMQRDNWCCQKCFDDEATLHVHHRRYIPDRDPWDYRSEMLITLCENCHETESLNMREQCESLIEQVQDKFLSEDVQEITIGIHMLEPIMQPQVVASAIGWALGEIDLQQYILDRYFEYLKNRKLDK